MITPLGLAGVPVVNLGQQYLKSPHFKSKEGFNSGRQAEKGRRGGVIKMRLNLIGGVTLMFFGCFFLGGGVLFFVFWGFFLVVFLLTRGGCRRMLRR